MAIQDEILSKAMRFCAYQDRSESEVRNKIATLNTGNIDIEEIVQRLKDEQFIDDIRFAESYVAGKLRQKGWGKLKLKNQLYQKGIAPSLIAQVITSIDDETYLNVLRQHIEKWLRLNEIEDRDLTKLYRFLESKGFERAIIFQYSEVFVKEIRG